MAKIAEYKFTDYENWDKAKSRLYDEINYDSIRSEGSNPYYIAIYDDCNDPKLAGQICRAYGGEPIY